VLGVGTAEATPGAGDDDAATFERFVNVYVDADILGP
jgi:hypothetical protein